MFHLIQNKISERVSEHVRTRYGVEISGALEQPKQSSFGELAIPAAFHLARQLKRAPKAIAAEIVAEIGPLASVAALEVAGNGYINVRLDRGAYGYALLHGAEQAARTHSGQDYRRAHQHQPQQSRPYRPSAERYPR